MLLRHASGHILNANTVALERIGWLTGAPDHPGIVRDAEGIPTGELLGPEVMTPMLNALGQFREARPPRSAVRAFARACVRTGVTTATELASAPPDESIGALDLTGEPAFPLRIVWAMHVRGQSVARTLERAKAQRTRSSQQLRLGCVKVHVDGSIQGFTARLKWPHYLDGTQGLWHIEPEHLIALGIGALEAGAAGALAYQWRRGDGTCDRTASPRLCASTPCPIIGSLCSIARWPTGPSFGG